MRRDAAAVDASATLTYHSFFMSRPFATPIVLVAALSVAAALGVGCAGSDEETKPITYSLTAKQNYEKGLAELKDDNFPEAQKYFQFVKQKYPFSKYAVLAELGIADTQFARGNYNEAIDSYKSFARLHPTHEKVEDGYVAFRICESYFKDMPDDVWILPPSYEKDQSAVVDAQREIDDFRKKYAESPYMRQGRGHPQRGAEAAGRSRGLRRALLSQERSPQGGGDAAGRRDPALPGIGARTRAAVLAGRDLPAHGRPAAGEGDVRARGHRVHAARRRRAGRSCISIHRAPAPRRCKRRAARRPRAAGRRNPPSNG